MLKKKKKEEKVLFLLKPPSSACRWLSSLSSHGLPSVHLCPNLFFQGHCPIGWEPTHMTSFYLNYLFKGPISKNIAPFWGTGVRTWTCEFWGGKILSINRWDHLGRSHSIQYDRCPYKKGKFGHIDKPGHVCTLRTLMSLEWVEALVLTQVTQPTRPSRANRC